MHFDYKQITDTILDWYARHQRDLPWRRTQDPYRIWVSEVMLQQTQVDTVIPYYHRFLRRFPTVDALASASLHDMLKVWENMGYYARARNLHAAAQEIVTHWDGKVPNRRDDLIGLTGIGEYIAGAILSIAFDQRVPAIDSNVRRVVSRLFAMQDPINQTSAQRQVCGLVKKLLPEQGSGRFNQALMDLGATLCVSRKPVCHLCPIQDDCQAYAYQLQHRLPVTVKRKAIPHRDMVAGIIRDAQGQILIVQRKNQGLLGGLWKVPGGRQEPGESSEIAVQRTVREETGVLIKVGEKITSIKHAYTHFRITLHAFHCTHEGGEPKTLGCSAWRWVFLDSLHNFAFSKADRMVIQALHAKSQNGLNITT
jgi:A/G-specific adenine glycosylase